MRPGFWLNNCCKTAIYRVTRLSTSHLTCWSLAGSVSGIQRSDGFFPAGFQKEELDCGDPADFDLVVSLQAMHELRHASRIPRLYAQLYNLLIPGGSLLVCDHVNSRLGSHDRHSFHDRRKNHLSTFNELGLSGRERSAPPPI